MFYNYPFAGNDNYFTFNSNINSLNGNFFNKLSITTLFEPPKNVH